MQLQGKKKQDEFQ